MEKDTKEKLDEIFDEEDLDKFFENNKRDWEFKEKNPEIKNKSIFTLWYMMAYLTMLYYDIWRIHWQKMPNADMLYYNSKIRTFVRDIDNIWWDNFKKIIQTIWMQELAGSTYLDIGLWWTPWLDLDLENFQRYKEWEITEEEFYWFLYKDLNDVH